MWIYALICIVIVGVDQFSKFEVVRTIPLGGEAPFIPHILSFTHIRNSGAAWSILEGKRWFFAVITVIAIVGVLYLFREYRGKSRVLSCGLSLILAGALGNLIDRVRQGYVVDMIRLDFINFPIFNIADMSLVIGVALTFIALWKLEDKRAWK